MLALYSLASLAEKTNMPSPTGTEVLLAWRLLDQLVHQPVRNTTEYSETLYEKNRLI